MSILEIFQPILLYPFTDTETNAIKEQAQSVSKQETSDIAKAMQKELREYFSTKVTSVLEVADKYRKSGEYIVLLNTLQNEQSKQSHYDFAINRAAIWLKREITATCLGPNESFMKFLTKINTSMLVSMAASSEIEEEGFSEADKHIGLFISILARLLLPVIASMPFFKVAHIERTSDDVLHLFQFINGALITNFIDKVDSGCIEIYPSHEYDYYCLSVKDERTSEVKIAKPDDVVFWRTGEVIGIDQYGSSAEVERVVVERLNAMVNPAVAPFV